MSRRLAKYLWGSPTANTWLSLFTRAISLVLVLPLVLKNFTAAESAVWFVFSTVLTLQGILNFGFGPSFARMLAYARAGGRVEDMVDLRRNQAIAWGDAPNAESIGRLISCMSTVFTILGIGSLLLMGTLGTAAVWRPVMQAGGTVEMWLAWAVIVVVSSFSFRTAHYTCLLQGMDRLTEWRRWETVTTLVAILTSFVVLLCGGRLLALVVANQFWALAALFVFRRLAYRLDGPSLRLAQSRRWEKTVFALVWNSAWKSGVTTVMTYGLIQSTGVIQAQFGSATATATYNFMLRIATMLGQIVQAPFLTKLPELARLRAQGNRTRQLVLIKRGMRLTHWSVVVVTAGVSLTLPLALQWIGSRSVVFDPLLWSLFALNVFLERHGGMLHQIRNLTNQPVEQYAMLGYFTICLSLLMMFLWLELGLYSYPLAMLGTQILFSEWLATRVAYRTMEVSFFEFEKSVGLPPLAALFGVVAWSFARSRT